MIDRLILFFLKNEQFIKILLFLTTLLIFLLTMLPPDKLGESSLYDYDKAGHFLIFFGWTLLYGLFMFSRKKTKTKVILIFLAGCLFGVAVEVLQEILPVNRNMDLYDALTDIVASFFAILVLFWIKRRYLSREMEKQLKNV